MLPAPLSRGALWAKGRQKGTLAYVLFARLLPNCYLALSFTLVVSQTVCYNKPMPATTPGGENRYAPCRAYATQTCGHYLVSGLIHHRRQSGVPPPVPIIIYASHW